MISRTRLSRRCPWTITKLLWSNKLATLQHLSEQREKQELRFDYSAPVGTTPALEATETIFAQKNRKFKDKREVVA